ncbi:hypothetical protein Plhal304r1_c054g0139171 [Plasmopara halstedii]
MYRIYRFCFLRHHAVCKRYPTSGVSTSLASVSTTPMPRCLLALKKHQDAVSFSVDQVGSPSLRYYESICQRRFVSSRQQSQHHCLNRFYSLILHRTRAHPKLLWLNATIITCSCFA